MKMIISLSNHPLEQCRTSARHYTKDILAGLITCSRIQYSSKILRTAFAAPDKKILTVGLPRTDIILSASMLTSKGHLRKDRILLYAPTWRENSEDSIVPPTEFLKKFEIFAEEKNLRLYIRFHPYTKNEVIKKISSPTWKFTRIITNERFDVNKFLPLVQLLITDHSGVVFDYILLHRPFVLIQIGQNERGFYEHASALFENYHADSWDALYHQIAMYESQGFQMQDKSKISQLACDYNSFIDLMNRKRIYEHFTFLHQRAALPHWVGY